MDHSGGGKIEWDELYTLLFPNDEVPPPPPPPPAPEPTGPIGVIRRSVSNIIARSSSLDLTGSTKKKKQSMAGDAASDREGGKDEHANVKAALAAVNNMMEDSPTKKKQQSEEQESSVRRSNSMDRSNNAEKGLKPFSRVGSFDFGDHGYGGVMLSGKVHEINVIAEEDEDMTPTPLGKSSTFRKVPASSTSSASGAATPKGVQSNGKSPDISNKVMLPVSSSKGTVTETTVPEVKLPIPLALIEKPAMEHEQEVVVDIPLPVVKEEAIVPTATTTVMTTAGTVTTGDIEEEATIEREPQVTHIPLKMNSKSKSSKSFVPVPASENGEANADTAALFNFVPGNDMKASSKSSRK